MGGGGGASNVNNIFVVVLTVLGLLAAGGYWWWQNRELEQREEIVAQRKTEADKLESIIKEVDDYQKRKDNLQKRIDLINELKKNQKGPVRIMDQISRDLPDLVWLDNMTINAGRVTLSGRGLNPNAIALFIENVKNDPYFEEPQVGAMTQASAVPLVYTFDMNFAFSYGPKTAEGAAAAAAAAANGVAANGTSTTGTTGSTATQ
jgi:type IV pilus assembly protein PilN